jgi:hypothetical protein
MWLVSSLALAACGEGLEASDASAPELKADTQAQAKVAERRIILYRTPAGELYTTLPNGKQVLVAARASVPVYSPDNQRAAFSKLPDTWNVGDPVTSAELHVIDLGSGRAVQVTGGNADFAPVWTPDNRFLLFVSSTRAAETSFWRVRANGTDLERLSVPQEDAGPQERRIILYLAPPTADSAVQFGPLERRIILYKTVGAQGHEIVVATFKPNFEVESATNLGPGEDPSWSNEGTVRFVRDGVTVEVSVE